MSSYKENEDLKIALENVLAIAAGMGRKKGWNNKEEGME